MDIFDRDEKLRELLEDYVERMLANKFYTFYGRLKWVEDWHALHQKD
jgi:hypothetical protein